MSEVITWHNDTLGEKAVAALRKNNFTADYFKTRQQALDVILELVPQKAAIGMGGSWTIKELGIAKLLESKEVCILDHGVPGLNPEEVLNIRRQQLTCDVFLTGTNALTLDGQLVNVDGVGNRVASMMFGPKKTIIVTGVNKIVKTVDDALKRIEFSAAPMNSKRLNLPTPCVKTGQCMDCESPSRICNITTIIRKHPMKSNIHVIIIGENLGF